MKNNYRNHANLKFVIFCLVTSIFYTISSASADLVGFTTDRTFASITPATGVVSPIGNPTGISGILMGSLALDPNSQSYFAEGYYGTDSDLVRIFTIDTKTGSIVSDPLVSGEFELIQFDPTPIPGPSTILLLGSGLVGLARLRKKLKVDSS